MCEKNEAIVCRRDKCVELREEDDDGVRNKKCVIQEFQVISTSAIDEEDKEEDQVAVKETRAVRVFDQVIVTVNLLSKQYCAFKNNTNKFVLNYKSIPSLFAC